MVLFRFIHGMSLASFVICVHTQQQKQHASCRSLQASQISASCQLINPSSVVRWLELTMCDIVRMSPHWRICIALVECRSGPVLFGKDVVNECGKCGQSGCSPLPYLLASSSSSIAGHHRSTKEGRAFMLFGSVSVILCDFRQRRVWGFLQKRSGEETTRWEECFSRCRKVDAFQTETRLFSLV